MTNSRIKILAIITALALTSAALGFKFLNFKSFNIETFKSLNFRSLNPENQRQISIFISEKSEDMSETYTNHKYGFSFGYPKEFNISEFTEGEADVILAKDETGDGFQIFIKPFDEPGPITKKRILKDIPDIHISNDKEISVGGEKALSFTSQYVSLETLEIWFVHGGNLYQISSFPDSASKLEKIIKTWAFQ